MPRPASLSQSIAALGARLGVWLCTANECLLDGHRLAQSDAARAVLLGLPRHFL